MAEEKYGKLYLEESAFEALEKGFQDVINLLKADKTLEKYRIEYEKLHTVMKKSHENEKRLMEKCRQLNAELLVNSSKVAVLTELSKEDQGTIASMKTEIEKSWKMVDAAYEKEKKMKETINSLQEETARLNNLVKQGSGPSLREEYHIRDLLKRKEGVTKERDQLLSEVAKLRQSLAQVTEQLQDTEKAKNEADQSITQLQQEILLHQNKASQEAQKKEEMEKQLKNLLVETDNKQAEIKNLQEYIQRSQEEQLKLEQHLKEQKILNERASKELKQFQMRNNKLMQESKQQSVMLEEVKQDIQQKTAELKARGDEVTQAHLEISKLSKVRDVLQDKLCFAEKQKVDAGHERNTLKNQIIGLERELEAAKKQAEIDKKAIDALVKEKDLLNQHLVKANSATQKQISLVKIHEQSKKSLEEEIEKYKSEAQKQRKIIYQLEKDRDSFINETSELKEKILQHMKDIEIREMQIRDCKKKIEESAVELKQEQSRCEAVRIEKNLYSKNLVEAKDEVAEMKKQLKTVTHQVDELKETIADKEAALVRARLEHQRIERMEESLKAELLKMKEQALETKQFIESQEEKEKNLLKIIGEADAERLKQKKEYDQVISERNILGSQLARCNDKVALLYEKTKIQQSILNKGEIQYRQRMEDIRLLKLEIKRLRCEKGVLGKSVSEVEELRQKVHHMQKELLREQARCKVLEKELENPLNVHRWRKLEASDPSTYEMIQKIQRLQKQLISKTGEVIEKELLLQEKERLYVELKHILARQPGPEVAEQLQHYQHTLREKTKQLKVLSSERNMYQSQSQEYKHEIERLAKELLDVKKKYLAQKHKEQHYLKGDVVLQAKEKEERLLTAVEPVFPRHRSDVRLFNVEGFPFKGLFPKITA
ncbi:cilia- and flagella-associated protein 58 [Falco peregrinus]|uniref:cilia- and flagella-associated protein 58 n=1 Tax=Falco peregrinus TaxID=8954 RepID=UPI0024797A86|nr:cilia- and flagella-associated protein 58 [Falco peregrinus]